MAFRKLQHLKVRLKMLEKGIRPTDLARMLGISKQSVNNILTMAGARYAEKLAEILGCRAEDITYMTEKKGGDTGRRKTRRLASGVSQAESPH